MEGLDSYSFHQELNQTSMNNPKPIILETISSWLDLDDPTSSTTTTSSCPSLFPQDLQMLDENYFHFTNTTTNMDFDHPCVSESLLLPYLPRPDDSPFILDLHEFDNNQPPITTEDHNCYHPVLPENTVHHHQEDNHDECETYFNVMAESPETNNIGVDQFFQSDENLILNMSSNSSSSNSEKDQQPMMMNIEKPQSSTDNCSPQTATTTTTAAAVVNDDDDEEEEIDDEPKKGTLNCKNLVSERNRRKRLSQQLLALRALVPNITKMDKRSVLVDALSYLKNMQEETARIQKELKEQQLLHQHKPRFNENNSSLVVDDDDDDDYEDEDNNRRNHIQRTLATTASKPKPQIIEIDIEKIEEKRFIIKITCKGANGVGGDVLRVMETIGFEITYTALNQIKPQHVLTTIFIKVKKQEKMTEEKLKDCIISSALRSGLTLLTC